MPTAEVAQPATDEARSLLGSVVTQIIAIVRQLIQYAITIMNRFIQFAGEHPLAAILTVANITIWVS